LQKELSAVAAVPWLLQFLTTHVAAGSRVLFNSFSAGMIWYLLAHQRAELVALRIEIVLVCPYHSGMEGTDFPEIVSYIQQSDFIRVIFTHHDLVRYYSGVAEIRDPLVSSLLQHAHRLSSSDFLAMGPTEAKAHKLLYVGNDAEAEEILTLIGAGSSIDPSRFALHGSTQKQAAKLMYDDEAYKMRAYANSMGELPGAIEGFWLRKPEQPSPKQ